MKETIKELIRSVKPLDRAIEPAIRSRLDDLTKPPGSLGLLEELGLRSALIQGLVKPVPGPKKIFTLAADHGVALEGVSAYPREVTPQMVMNFLGGGAAVNVLARHAGADIAVVDMGVDFDFPSGTDLIDGKIAKGTQSFTSGHAMSLDEAEKGILFGASLAREAARSGYTLIGVGEMGIGNTTSASAILAAFTGLSPDEVVGRGTGVDDEGLRRKALAVERALKANRPDTEDPLDVLSKVGGFEIAGMAGIYLGAAAEGVAVVADGFISTSAALIAKRLAPPLEDYLFLSHLSDESGHAKMLELFGSRAILDLGMRLGEGTGCALAFGVMEAGMKILSEMATFSEAGVSNKE